MIIKVDNSNGRGKATRWRAGVRVFYAQDISRRFLPLRSAPLRTAVARRGGGGSPGRPSVASRALETGALASALRSAHPSVQVILGSAGQAAPS